MVKVIDVRSADGQLAILGGGLKLPDNSVTISGTTLLGSIRYNVGSEVVEVWTGSSWSAVGSLSSITLTGAVTGSGIGTVNTTLNAGLTDLNDVQFSGVSNGNVLIYSSGDGKWENVAPPYDIYGTFLSTPTDSQVMWRIVIVRPLLFPANLPGSYAVCEQEATADLSLPILQNGVQIGSIDFPFSSISGSFTFSADVTFAPGDILEVDGPSPVDATFFGPSWGFAAVRS